MKSRKWKKDIPKLNPHLCHTSMSLFITCVLQLWILFCQTLGSQVGGRVWLCKVTAGTEAHMPTSGRLESMERTDILPAPHPGAHLYGCWGPPLLSSVSASLRWPLPGPLTSVPSVFPSAKGICTSIRVTTGKVHQESKGCTSLLRFLRSQNCKSLLHRWLLAGCQYSSPEIFLIPFGQENKPGS